MTPIRITIRFASLTLCALLACSEACAQAGDRMNAGTLQRLQKDQDPQRNQDRLPPAPAVAPQVLPGTDITVEGALAVQAFLFVGNTLISQGELSLLLADLVDKPLAAADLQAAAERVTALYASYGYNLARVVIPPQKVEEGRLTLMVFEGRLQKDGIELLDFTAGQANLPYIASIFERQIDPDAVIRRAEYERALRLVENLPGVTLKSWLYPGDRIGTARLRADLRPTTRHLNTLSLGNYGSASTGSMRLGLSSVHENVLGQHERLRIDLGASSRRLDYLGLEFLMPVGTDGWYLGGDIDHIRYALRSGFTDDDERGDATHASLKARYPLTLLSDISWVAQASLDGVQQKEVGAYADRWHIAYLHASLLGEFNWNAAHTRNTSIRLNLATGENRALDADLLNADGEFTQLAAEILHAEPLAPRLALFSQLRAQWANRNLNGFFKCNIGGPFANRGYPVGQIAADICVQFNNELMYMHDATWRFSLFADVARTRDNARNVAGELNYSDTPVSLGASATAQLDRDTSATLTIGHQLAHTEERRLRGFDADHRRSSYRAWFLVQHQF